jgi:FtsP/CotA-like multicopper oxidase with cupredoxin domain
VEVLAGVYDVDVIALGRWGTTRVRLAPGEDRTITVTVPGTAGIDIGDVAKSVGLAGIPTGIRCRRRCDGD